MRGFRGNRANQNQMAFRYGHHQPHYNPHGTGNSHSQAAPSGNAAGAQPGRPQLPDWVKTPETRAREEADRLRGGSVPTRPQLSVIQGGAEPKASAPAKAKSSAKAAAPVPGAKARSAGPGRAPAARAKAPAASGAKRARAPAKRKAA